MFDLAVVIVLFSASTAPMDHSIVGISVKTQTGWPEKAKALLSAPVMRTSQTKQLTHPDERVSFELISDHKLLSEYADSYWGLGTGDDVRYVRFFWEVSAIHAEWIRHQGTVARSVPYGGRERILRWASGAGELAREPGAFIRGVEVWGSRGVAVSQTGDLAATIYTGEAWNQNCAPIIPKDAALHDALWAYCSSPEYAVEVRKVDRALKVTNATLVKVPFDVDHWRQVAEEAGALPEPWSDDPTQWLFEGRPEVSSEPLQVAVGRLLGYRWPEQPESDDLSELADRDGIVCLPSVLGERPAAERLQELLARAFGATWSPARTRELLAASGSKKTDLDSWLRDEFFKAHCQVFKNRPFVWHIWDGRKDGFSALVNYHRLDGGTLRRLSYTYLGDWIERQEAADREGLVGAEARLLAARDLQRRLALTLEGEPPYDIFVRWKSLSAQPLGWDPDLDDGVRLNVRPFVEAGVLRAKFNVNWNKDRGKNPDGSERLNDRHFTLAEKRAAQGV
jgi:hypothetical protein